MFCKVMSAGLKGIDGFPVSVEADVGDGLPDFTLVGFLSGEVREAGERVRTAIRNCGFRIPPKRVTVNLSPANIRKDGTAFDLAIAVALLGAYGILDAERLNGFAFIGELGLDGMIKPVLGVLPLAASFEHFGLKGCFLPQENLAEGLAGTSIDIYRAVSLKQLVEDLTGLPVPVDRTDFPGISSSVQRSPDFSDVNGQTMARRAAEISAAGMHNILLIGPPGSGKSMIAQRIPSVLPPLSRDEQLEISRVYSVCGMLGGNAPLVSARPFRAPHHTVSPQALTGGGHSPKPGEISLADRGVLFLDELPEFARNTLEILRQPLEERQITVSRVHGTYVFPANIILAAAMNPCPCGYFPDRKKCTCNELQINKYLGRISRPLLDRIDICVEVAPVSYAELRSNAPNESSQSIRSRVIRAYEVQKKRFQNEGILFNSEMKAPHIKEFCRLDPAEEDFVKLMFHKNGLSARGLNRTLKTARTIADIDGAEKISRSHLAEAFGYRDPQERYWTR